MKQTCFVERVSQAFELSHSIFNRTILYIHFDQLKKWVSCGGGGEGEGGCERTRRTPSPYKPGFCKLFFYFRGIHSHSCIMGNNGKMVGY